MRHGTSMKVRVQDLPSRQEIDLAADFVRLAIDGLPVRAALERPADDPQAGAVRAEIELSVEHDNVFARGTVRGWMEVACSRCVEATRIVLDEAIVASFLPRAGMPTESEDEVAEATEDDVDLYPYDDEEVDLEPMLREQLVLAIPYAPLCKPDCKGLCVVCGVDMNRESCGCDRHIVDPRLAALRDLKV
ncbi:MAG TPA: DUF177 domain-containing protein [Kofleriaceae bacterium]|nr:DUF177 domain-containing protein [Kofleriaceae bacterium]